MRAYHEEQFGPVVPVLPFDKIAEPIEYTQAYFYRNALKMATLFIPLLKVYRVLLYPVAKPCALILDAWLGRESIH
jgi:hypothetical protein